jgi:hypothetical protein
MSAGHRFPPPWSVQEQDGRFVVRDRNGQALSYVYFKDQRDRRLVGTLYSRAMRRGTLLPQSQSCQSCGVMTKSAALMR